MAASANCTPTAQLLGWGIALIGVGIALSKMRLQNANHYKMPANPNIACNTLRMRARIARYYDRFSLYKAAAKPPRLLRL